MAVTDWTGAPTLAKVPEGYDALHRAWVLGDATAAPIVPYNVVGVQNITTTPFTPQSTKQVYQQGGGEDEFYEKRRMFQHQLTVQMLSGDVEAFIARIKGLTLGTDYAVPMTAHGDPLLHWEIVVRQPDGTHLFSKVYRELILREWNFGSPMEDEVVDIPFYSKYSPFTLYTGSELVVDKFAGDGSTVAFTLSGTPVKLTTATNREHIDWYYDQMCQVVYKTSAQNYGTHQKTGYSNITTAVTATTAPAASSVLTITYAKEVAP